MVLLASGAVLLMVMKVINFDPLSGVPLSSGRAFALPKVGAVLQTPDRDFRGQALTFESGYVAVSVSDCGDCSLTRVIPEALAAASPKPVVVFFGTQEVPDDFAVSKRVFVVVDADRSILPREMYDFAPIAVLADSENRISHVSHESTIPMEFLRSVQK